MSLLHELRSDVRAPLERDPAYAHWLDLVLSYPGVHAVVAHRFIHRLARVGVPVLPRFLSQLVRFATGIEIHPTAEIGPGLFIDHGLGVVIGATTVIGKNVTLYQGVTLGGTSLERDEKRHPTIGDEVVVGVGASVLGNIVVGEHARIGAGSVVIRDVPERATVVGIPGKVVQMNGVPATSLEQRVQRLEQRLEAALEHKEISNSPHGNERNGDVSSAL